MVISREVFVSPSSLLASEILFVVLISLFASFFFTMLQQKCVKARALYDNIAEAPDELAFRKGDVLTVLEQNTAGLEGWWLCALRGRQVINYF